jgi:hypothetical protein
MKHMQSKSSTTCCHHYSYFIWLCNVSVMKFIGYDLLRLSVTDHYPLSEVEQHLLCIYVCSLFEMHI